MNRKNKIIIVVGILFAIIICLFWVARVSQIKSSIGSRVIDIDQLMHSFIRANYGHFPTSEVDLEKQGFLKKIETPNGVEYFVRFVPEQKDWYPYPHFRFDWFKISYGASVDNLEVINGKLYEKSTHKPILLIDGPHKIYMKSAYQFVSLRWYELMLQERQQPRALQEPNSNTE